MVLRQGNRPVLATIISVYLLCECIPGAKELINIRVLVLMGLDVLFFVLWYNSGIV